MAVIACLGWGSLIWDLRELPVQRQWHQDGPFVKVEFARKSSDGRLTLVMVDDADAVPVRSLWATMAIDNLKLARDALKKREGAKDECHIGDWSAGQQAPTAIPTIANWAKAQGVDAAVWTALPPKFEGNNEVSKMPSPDEVISYLTGLRGAARDNAERYIRLAPRQIDTPYRQRIEAELGWTALDHWPSLRR